LPDESNTRDRLAWAYGRGHTVSAGATCVEANGWSTAAVVWGEDAPGNLDHHGVTARLVRGDGRVVTVGAWPGVANVVPSPTRAVADREVR